MNQNRSLFIVSLAVENTHHSQFLLLTQFGIKDDSILTGVNQNTGGTYPPEDDWVDIAFTLDTTDPTYAVVVGTDLQLFLDGTNVAYDNIVIEKISSVKI